MFRWKILETCPVSKLDEREIYWIQKLKTADPEFGYNKHEGGHVNHHMHTTEEHRRKLSEALKGRKLSLEFRKKLSAGQRRRFRNPEEREKIAKAFRGKKQTAEQKQRQSEGQKGKPHPFSEEGLRSFREKMVGRKRTLEQRQRMKEAQQRVSTKEKRKRTYSDPVVRARLSESIKRSWVTRRARKECV